MQKVAGFTSAHTNTHTHRLPPRLHILEKNALSLWINQAQIEQIFCSQQKRKKANERGEEKEWEVGWGRQYNRHTQLGNPNWNLTNCCLRMATSKLVSVQVNQRVWCKPPYLLYNLWYIQLHSASQTVKSDSLCKF